MNDYHFKTLAFILFFSSLCVNASNLSDDAKNRGINETCYKYLSQIEKSYNLKGLNITFAHPENPSIFPSLHISSQKYKKQQDNYKFFHVDLKFKLWLLEKDQTYSMIAPKVQTNCQNYHDHSSI